MINKSNNFKDNKKIFDDNCPDADRCYLIKEIHNDYDLNFMIKNYCSKKGLNCPIKEKINKTLSYLIN